jgi:hypothetical protein
MRKWTPRKRVQDWNHPPRCRPSHQFNSIGQCVKCNRWRKGTIERYLGDFWQRVKKGNGCWEWQGGLDIDGYAKYSYNGSTRKASRFMWVIMHGGIDAGLTLDHLCRNRKCVNPAHLEAVTHAENRRRAIKPVCKNGHKQTPDNRYVYHSNGKRRERCKACIRLRVFDRR